MKKLSERIDDLKLKFSFPVVKQPKHIKKMRTKMTIRTIIVQFIFSMFAFAIKGSQIAIQNDMETLAVLLLIFYFSERVIESAYGTYSDFQEDSFRQFYLNAITENVMDMLNKTRNKTFKKNENGIESLMPHPEMLRKTKDYITAVWWFWWGLPTAISNSVTLIIMIVFTIKLELLDNSTEEIGFIIFLLLICVAVYFFFAKKRIDVMKEYRKTRRENDAKEDVLFSEVNGIEYASTKDFSYHANRFIKHIVDSEGVLKQERFKLNSVFIKRSMVASIFMILIVLYRLFNGGKMNQEMILSIVAVSTVYSSILDKISSILDRIETIMNYIIDIDKLYPDFENIYSVYESEKEKEKLVSKEYLENQKIQVNPFDFSYNERNSWRLINSNPFELVLGEVGIIQGETGAGKTTTLNVLCGNVRTKESPIQLTNGNRGYLKTLTYHTDRSMADNYILNEIILDDDYSVVDEEKLFEILDGLGLKETFVKLAKNDEAFAEFKTERELILEFMKLRTYKQFSSGQQQRLALAKLLYTLDESVQAIWLDEAFNRLNDEVADQCAKFIFEYVNRDIKRVVLVATHQVSIIKPYSSKSITFERDDKGISYINVDLITKVF